MASPKIITFDESAHTAQLVSAGLDEQSAAELSAKIAFLHAEGVALARAKQGLGKAGVESAKAQQLAVATRRFKQAPDFEAPAVPPARTAGFKSMGDLLSTPDLSQTPARPVPTPESVDAMKTELARRTPVKRAAKSAESKSLDVPSAHADVSGSVGNLLISPVPSQPQRASVPAPEAVDAGEAKPAKQKPAKRTGSSLKTRKIVPVYDYSTGEIPNKIRDLIDAHLAIEQEDAKSAGSLGFMTRSLAIATLPHKRYEGRVFERKNGDFNLTMMTAHPEGLPFGIVPRMLLTWVCTEAVQTGDRVLNLGSSLAGYMQIKARSEPWQRGF